MLQVRRVLETALYVEDLDRAVEFYQRVIGLNAIFHWTPFYLEEELGMVCDLLDDRRKVDCDGVRYVRESKPS